MITKESVLSLKEKYLKELEKLYAKIEMADDLLKLFENEEVN